MGVPGPDRLDRGNLNFNLKLPGTADVDTADAWINPAKAKGINRWIHPQRRPNHTLCLTANRAGLNLKCGCMVLFRSHIIRCWWWPGSMQSQRALQAASTNNQINKTASKTVVPASLLEVDGLPDLALAILVVVIVVPLEHAIVAERRESILPAFLAVKPAALV